MTRQTRLSTLFAVALVAGSIAADARTGAGPLGPTAAADAASADSSALDESDRASAMSALSLKLDAFRNSAGRQIVVLHFPATDLNSWLSADNSFPANNQRRRPSAKRRWATATGAWFPARRSRSTTAAGTSPTCCARPPPKGSGVGTAAPKR